MRGSPAKVLEAIDQYAREEECLMNIGEMKGEIITEIIAEKKPKLFVELGGYVGYSTLLFGDAVRKAGKGQEGLRFWSLEAKPVFGAIVMALVELAGLGDIVKVVVGPANESLKRMKDEGVLKHIDMLFLDHVEDLYVQDFQVCEELGLFKKGTTVVADNVIVPGAPKYRKFVQEHSGVETKGIKSFVPMGWPVS
jgi:catechol O-methyltransferase